MPLSKDVVDIQDRIANCRKELATIQRMHKFEGRHSQINEPIHLLEAAFFGLDKTIGALLRLEREYG